MRPALLLSCVLLTVPVAADPASRHAEWPGRRFVKTPAACLRHADLVQGLNDLQARHPGRVAVEEIGRSVEGRSIHLLRVGRGPTKILLWSQMHGDEPSATPALLDLAHSLVARPDDPEAQLVLERLTLLMVPMVNPDGAERYERRNALGIDVNRDALNLATPEGRLLEEVRDRHQPQLGFNLHDQDRRTVVGETGGLATISLLAVAGDPQGTVTEGRLRAKRVASALVAALGPLLGATSIGRYDEDWSPRAFGDNITAWGTPVVLVESGGLSPGQPHTELTRYNYVALHEALLALARNDAADHDPAVYEALARNSSDAFADVVVRGGLVAQPPAKAPYRADVAFNVDVADADRFGCAGRPAVVPRSAVEEVGDARFIAAGRTVDAAGRVLVPALVVSVETLGAATWLGADVLETLAGLGVAQVSWHVAPEDVAAAEHHARTMAAPSRPAVVVQADGGARAGLRLAGPPGTAASRRLADVVQALQPGADVRAAAELLPAGTRLPLATGAPASLLVLKPDPQAPADLLRATIEAVFVDGRDTSTPRVR